MVQSACSIDLRATIIKIDRNQPQLHLLPTNNDRTCYQPFSYPVVISCPRAISDGYIANRGPIDSFKISLYGDDAALLRSENAYIPSYPLVEFEIGGVELLADYAINLANGSFCSIEGLTFFQFTARSGHLVRMEYYQDMIVYDISNHFIDTRSLPNGHYRAAYTATFNLRLLTEGLLNEFYCISDVASGKSELQLNLNHPGDLLSFFQRGTPAFIFTGAHPADEPTLQFYRPFTDIFQDIYDEQRLIPQINYVYNSTNETFPYLSYILGWAAPYFPANDTAGIRKALLRRTVELQGIRGSLNSITYLFEILGYDIKLEKLWATPDGKQFIAPNDYYNGVQYLTSSYVGYTDILINDWTPENSLLNDSIKAIGQQGFYSFTAPLRKNLSNGPSALRNDLPSSYRGATVQVIGVIEGSAAQQYLKALALDVIHEVPPAYYETAYIIDDNGNLITEPGIIDPRVDCLAATPWFTGKAGFVAQTYANVIDSPIPVLITNGVESQHFVSGDQNQVILCQPYQFKRGDEFGQSNGLTLDLTNNRIKININIPLYNNTNADYTIKNLRLYVFATYWTQDLVVKDSLVKNLFSNRATIEIIDKVSGDPINPKTILFALEYLQNVQSAHSIVNLVRYRLDISESYLVADMSIGGDFPQKHTVDFGKWQVPEGRQRILTPQTGKCTYDDPVNYGYTEADIRYRKRLIDNLLNELNAYRSYNSTTGSGIYVVYGDANDGSYRPAYFTALLGDCPYNERGQTIALNGRADETDYNDSFIARSPCGGYWERPDLVYYSPTKAAGNWDYNQIISPEPAIITTYGGDNSMFGAFSLQATTTPATLCEIPTTGDYFYLGRSTDHMLLQPTCLSDELITLNFGAVFGTGCYATYPLGIRTIRPGVLDPCYGSQSDRQVNTTPLKVQEPGQSFLGNLARSYAVQIREFDPQTRKTTERALRPQELLFTDDFDPNKPLESFIAYRKPSLNIVNPIFHLPGCRFPNMRNLKSTFTSPTYRFRPWDGSLCSAASYNTPYTIIGNGIPADIDTLENLPGEDIELSGIVHTIFDQAPSRSYVSFDCLSELGTDNVINVSPALFTSAEFLNTEILDVAAGNPSERGYFTYSYFEDPARVEAFELLGVPSGSTGPFTMAFRLSSGILNGMGYRLNLNGVKVVDGQVTFTVPDGIYKNGIIDPSYDSCLISSVLKSDEDFGAGGIKLDGYITTLMEVA